MINNYSNILFDNSIFIYVGHTFLDVMRDKETRGT